MNLTLEGLNMVKTIDGTATALFLLLLCTLPLLRPVPISFCS